MGGRSVVGFVVGLLTTMLLWSCGGPAEDPAPPRAPDGIDETHNLDESGWRFQGNGVVVDFPPLVPGATAWAGVGVSDDHLVDEAFNPRGSRITIWLEDQAAWRDDQSTVRITMPVDVGAPERAVVAVTSRDDTSSVLYVTLETSAGSGSSSGPSANADDTIVAVEIPAQGPSTLDVQVLTSLEPFLPEEETWYRIDLGQMPTVPHSPPEKLVDAEEFCNDTERLDSAFLSRDLPAEPRSRAVIIVHGWQTLGGLWKGAEGDVPSNPAHCMASLAFAASVATRSEAQDAGQAEPWRELATNADLYVVRYDSDKAVAHGASVLLEVVTELRSHYGNDITLLGHSMGGVVASVVAETTGLSVVTLSAPLWGAPVGCTELGADPDDPTINACVQVMPPFEPIQNLLGFGVAYDSASALTLSTAWDLSSFPDAVETFPNPYLEALTQRTDSYQDLRQWAIVGSIGSAQCGVRVWDIECLGQRSLRAKWGENDGLIPVASSAGVPEFARDASDSVLNHLIVPRSHSELTSGCISCNDDYTTDEFDEYLTIVARAVNDVAGVGGTIRPNSLYATIVQGETYSSKLEIVTPRFATAVEGGTSATWISLSTDDGDATSATIVVTIDTGGLNAGIHEDRIDVSWTSPADGGTTYLATVPVRIAVISSEDSFRLSGTVKSSSGAVLHGVVVSVEIAGVSFAATTDEGGSYDFTFDTGGLVSADVRFAKGGFESLVIPISFAGQATMTLDASIDELGALDILYFEDFETCGSQWQVQNAGTDGIVGTADDGLWRCREGSDFVNEAFLNGFVSPMVGDDSEGAIPDAYAGTRAMWYGSGTPVGQTPRSETANFLGVQAALDVPGSGGTSTSANSGKLISPPLDLSAVAAARLEGFAWYELESVDIATGQYDQAAILVYDGHPDAGGELLREIYLNPPFEPELQVRDLPYTSGGQLSPPHWVPFAVDLGPAIGSPNVHVVFVFRTNDHRFNGFRGWLLDEVGVYRGGGPSTVIGSRSRSDTPPVR